jgi:hypothetical protein
MARTFKPSIIFIDDADAVFGDRESPNLSEPQQKVFQKNQKRENIALKKAK